MIQKLLMAFPDTSPPEIYNELYELQKALSLLNLSK